MPPRPEHQAREQIDRMIEQAGWAVQDAKADILYANQGVAIREFEQEVLHFVERRRMFDRTNISLAL